ncbi:hypothetical protein [Burkholderia gladioli]|uniref:hypothetical protein n=1 Tax=Burkholderia gladioli TaxID=28095 RepID=UPI0034DAF6F8
MIKETNKHDELSAALVAVVPAQIVVEAVRSLGVPRDIITGERQLSILRGLLAHAEGAICMAAAPIGVHELNLTAAERDVLTERCRQRTEKGWTAESDDRLTSGQLSAAASAYAAFASDEIDPASLGSAGFTARPPKPWPWERKWWKPSTVRHSLVKAAALILAEIERIDRAVQGGRRA